MGTAQSKSRQRADTPEPGTPRPTRERPGQGIDQAALGSKQSGLLKRIYRTAVLTRIVDERLWVLSRQGSVSFVITPRGHEVAQAASAAAIRRGLDSAWPYYRDMAVGFALGVTPYEIFLGALGRAVDPHSGGRQLTAHMSSRQLQIGSISSAIAGQVPHAVGAAYASVVRGIDSVAFCWMGEGATSAGQTHEAMNLAATRRFPVVFLVENNGLAISVPQALQMPIKSAAVRGVGYEMPGVSIDGSDALAVYAATTDARERARQGRGPSLIELRVVRITPHSSQDDDSYRTDAERSAAASEDPIVRLKAALLHAGLMTEDEDAELTSHLRQTVQDDENRALAQPHPEPSRARRWLFVGDDPLDENVRSDSAISGMSVFDD